MNRQSCYNCCTYKMTEERRITTCLHQVLKNVTCGTNVLSKPAVNSLRMKSVTCNANSQVSLLQSLFINVCALLPVVSALNHVQGGSNMTRTDFFCNHNCSSLQQLPDRTEQVLTQAEGRVEVVASLSQGRTGAAQCGLFTHKSVLVIFEPPYTYAVIIFVLFTGIFLFMFKK